MAAVAGPVALVVPVLLDFVEAPVVVELGVAALAVVGPAAHLVGSLVVAERVVLLEVLRFVLNRSILLELSRCWPLFVS